MKKYLFFGIVFLLFSCNKPVSNQEKPRKHVATRKVEMLHDTLIKQVVKPQKSVIPPEPGGDCIRGQATPIINKRIFPQSHFVLQPDHLTAFETVVLPGGDKLIIHNWGCEYYILTFRFETSRLKADVNDLAYWYRQAYVLLTFVGKGMNTKLLTKMELDKLHAFIESKGAMALPDFKLGEEIVCSSGDIQEFFTLDKIQQLTECRFAIEISYYVGPL